MSQRRVGKSSALLPRLMDFRGFAYSCHQGVTVLAFTWTLLQQLLQGSFTPEPGKTFFTFSLLFLIVTGLVICVQLIFSVWIAAACKDHSLRLLVPNTDGQSVRIRAGSFLCWSLPLLAMHSAGSSFARGCIWNIIFLSCPWSYFN